MKLINNHIGHSEKVLVMRIFMAVLVLIFSLQSLSKADDIKDIEIEGMSIGDSVLDFFSEEEIKKNTVDWYKSDRYITIEIVKNFDMYDSLQISFLKKDSKKKISGIDGLVDYINNIDKCYKKIDEIYKEIKSIVPNLNDEGKLTYEHSADETGKSTITDYVLENNNHDEIQIACYDYSKSFGNNLDHLRVGIRLVDFRKWIRNEAYN